MKQSKENELPNYIIRRQWDKTKLSCKKGKNWQSKMLERVECLESRGGKWRMKKKNKCL